MRRLIAYNTLYLLVLCIGIFTDAYAGDWYVEKHIKISASSRFEGNNKLTTQVNALAIKAEYQGDSIDFYFDGEWQYDAVYDLHSGFGEQVEEEYGNRFWLDEAYLSWNWGEYDVSFGYQKVVWGQADDLRIVDVLNPLDLKDFVLFDIDEYRISQPMLRVEKTIGHWDIEGLWIVASESNQFPPIGSEFSVGIAGISDHHPGDGEFGLEAKTFFKGADISLYAFRGRNDNPVLTTSTTGGARFEYYRETMLGASLSRPIGDWVARGELAWFDNREFNRNDFSRSRSDVLQWLVGIDYLYKDWLFTGQVTDHNISGWNDSYSVEKNEPFYTLSADATVDSGKTTVRFAVSHADFLGSGQLYQSKLSYRPNVSWRLQFNIDVLSGDQSNFFGQFADKDRIWIAADYLF